MDPPAVETKLRDGSTATIRPVAAGDGPLLQRIYSEMSDLSRRRRFLAPTSELSDEDAAYLADVDHRRHDALMALDGDRPVGVARFVRTPGDRESAEVAVVVIDAWHRRGLGTLLLDRLTERARENGILRYTAVVSPDNEVVLRSLDQAGATRTGTTDGGEIEFTLKLPSEGLGDRLAATLRAAAEGRIEFVAAVLSRLAVWRRSG